MRVPRVPRQVDKVCYHIPHVSSHENPRQWDAVAPPPHPVCDHHDEAQLALALLSLADGRHQLRLRAGLWGGGGGHTGKHSGLSSASPIDSAHARRTATWSSPVAWNPPSLHSHAMQSQTQYCTGVRRMPTLPVSSGPRQATRGPHPRPVRPGMPPPPPHPPPAAPHLPLRSTACPRRCAWPARSRSSPSS